MTCSPIGLEHFQLASSILALRWQAKWDWSLQMQSNCFFCVYLLHFHGLTRTCEFCAHMSESHWLLLCPTLSLHVPPPCQPITLNPCSYPICQALKMYVSCQVATLLSQHAFYTTCYPPNTHLELEETGFNIILILTEHARAPLRPPRGSPQAVWALECITQEHLNSNWCTSSPMQPEPAEFSL